MVFGKGGKNAKPEKKQEDEKGKGPYKCPRCSFAGYSASGLRSHQILNIHKDSDPR